MSQTRSRSEFSQSQLNQFCELIHDEAGLVLDQSKYRTRLRNKILKRMGELDFGDPDEYYEYVWFSQDSNQELRKLINACVVNETLFYRNKQQMDILENEIFPRLLRSRQSTANRKIRILSAGCSNGAEPYSLAMAFYEACRETGRDPEQYDLNVLGVDISTRVLSEAEKAVYSRRPVRNAPKRIEERYFKNVSEQYQVVDTIRRHVSFRYLNLVNSALPCDQDLVFHRNVMIYFDSNVRENVIERLHRSLKNDGLLFVGNSEDISPYRDYFRPSEWKQVQIFEKWTTDQRENSLWDHDGGETSGQADERRQPPFQKEPPQILRKQESSGDGQLIRFKGVVGNNILPHQFRARLSQAVNPGEKRYRFDLRSMPYIDNKHLRQFHKLIRIFLEEQARVVMITSSNVIKDWVENTIDHPFVRVKPDLSDSRRNLDESPKTETVSAPEPSESNGESRSAENSSKTSHIDQLLAETTPDKESPNIEVSRQSYRFQLVLRGNLNTEQKPDLIRRVKEEITDILGLLSDPDREEEKLNLNLNHVEYIDRNLVKIIKRTMNLTEDEDYEVQLDCTKPTIRQNLERWGCSL